MELSLSPIGIPHYPVQRSAVAWMSTTNPDGTIPTLREGQPWQVMVVGENALRAEHCVVFSIFISHGEVGCRAVESFRPPCEGTTNHHTLTRVGGIVYLFGGATGPLPPSRQDLVRGWYGYMNREMGVYTVSDHSWSKVSLDGGVPPRYMHTAFACNNELWVCGGVDKSGRYLSDTWCYNPSSKCWSMGPALPVTLVMGAGCTDSKGVVHIVGGQTSRNLHLSLINGVWSRRSLPFSCYGAGVACIEDHMWVVGGVGHEAGVHGYNTSTGLWTTPAPSAPNLTLSNGDVQYREVMTIVDSSGPVGHSSIGGYTDMCILGPHGVLVHGTSGTYIGVDTQVRDRVAAESDAVQMANKALCEFVSLCRELHGQCAKMSEKLSTLSPPTLATLMDHHAMPDTPSLPMVHLYSGDQNTLVSMLRSMSVQQPVGGLAVPLMESLADAEFPMGPSLAACSLYREGDAETKGQIAAAYGALGRLLAVTMLQQNIPDGVLGTTVIVGLHPEGKALLHDPKIVSGLFRADFPRQCQSLDTVCANPTGLDVRFSDIPGCTSTEVFGLR
ncbi:hypothetical protein KIPB_000236 [Kipferlia bialata]|uniref:Uncharacterized protein n=1 Tax=Kipferlia bialata TaxID=797122 RepID=A0A391NIU7_9EUKA|nr:hypothetical protein KIPB_000236 [Kipferlia bialata]|eukprot:g236.t1